MQSSNHFIDIDGSGAFVVTPRGISLNVFSTPYASQEQIENASGTALTVTPGLSGSVFASSKSSNSLGESLAGRVSKNSVAEEYYAEIVLGPISFGGSTKYCDLGLWEAGQGISVIPGSLLINSLDDPTSVVPGWTGGEIRIGLLPVPPLAPVTLEISFAFTVNSVA